MQRNNFEEDFDLIMKSYMHKIAEKIPPDRAHSKHDIIKGIMTYVNCHIYPIVLEFIEEEYNIP